MGIHYLDEYSISHFIAGIILHRMNIPRLLSYGLHIFSKTWTEQIPELKQIPKSKIHTYKNAKSQIQHPKIKNTKSKIILWASGSFFTFRLWASCSSLLAASWFILSITLRSFCSSLSCLSFFRWIKYFWFFFHFRARYLHY